MEAQAGAASPEPNKDIQSLLKPSGSGDLTTQPSHNPSGEDEIAVPSFGLLQVTERRHVELYDEDNNTVTMERPTKCSEPLSSVSSLEVHFDLLDLTELTDMSDQELAEVFADSDEENHNESPASHHQPSLPRGGYTRSPSWTRCSRGEQPRDRKHHSDSENTEPFLKKERAKQL